MTSRRQFRSTPALLARRGVLLSGPALLLAGCGLLPGGDDAAPTDGTTAEDADDAAAEGSVEDAADDVDDAQAVEDADEQAPGAASTQAVLDITVVEVEDEIVAGGLMQRLEGSETLRHPFAEVTVTSTALLDSLTAEQYTALTGEEVPPADGTGEDGDEPVPATTLLPGTMKKFLLAAWESTDAQWVPEPRSGPSTTLHIAYGGNDDIRVTSVQSGDTERSGIVLAVVDATPDPRAATLRASIEDGAQDISLVDGSIVSTVAPRLYTGDYAVEVSDAGVFETEIEDEYGTAPMQVRGTVESALLTSFLYPDSTATWGGMLKWADEDEVFVVVQLDWEKNYSSNITELGEVVLELPDGTELTPEQDPVRIFSHHGSHTATFTVPAHLETATVRITPRYQKALDSDFDETHDPLTATLTFT